MESPKRFDMEKTRKLIENELVRLISTGKQKDLVLHRAEADAFDVLMRIYRTLGSITRQETALDRQKRWNMAHAFRTLEQYTFINQEIILQGDAFMAEHVTQRITA